MSKAKPQKSTKSASFKTKTSKSVTTKAKSVPVIFKTLPKNSTKSKTKQPKIQPLQLENQLIAKIEQRLSDEIATLERPSIIGFLPARISFIINALYFLAFAVIALYASSNGLSAISSWLTLPLDQSLSTIYLLEISGAFGMIIALLLLMAAQKPQQYLWLYLLLILLVQPANLIGNLTKMQLDSTLMFQNYLFFDTVLVTVLWALNLLSLKAFWKIIKFKK